MRAPGDLVEGRAVGPRLPEAVVEVAGPVDADADQEVVLGEEFAPLVVAVRLEGVDDAFVSRRVLCLEADDLAIEVESAEHRFAALPGERDLQPRMALDVLAHERFERVAGHLKVGPLGVQLRFLEVEAVVARQVARRTGRFGHHMERRLPFGSRPGGVVGHT